MYRIEVCENYCRIRFKRIFYTGNYLCKVYCSGVNRILCAGFSCKHHVLFIPSIYTNNQNINLCNVLNIMLYLNYSNVSQIKRKITKIYII